MTKQFNKHLRSGIFVCRQISTWSHLLFWLCNQMQINLK